MTTPQQPQQQPAQTGRRAVVSGAAAAGIAVTATAATGAPAEAATGGSTTRKVTLTVMGTTDLHGNVFNWDYFKNAEYDDSAHNDIGAGQGLDAWSTRSAADAGATATRCSSTPATPSRARRWRTTTPRSSRSRGGVDPPDGARR